ncbi:hypothetical protein GNVKYODX_CDS24 [Acinetobacter phage vB_AbaM_AB3P2]|nr:hypothetical protein GNVKYODX_CDS24 [Acinetobacter phage vB_AbaM_AB3P2]
MSKYDWAEIPNEFNFAATDKDGTICYFAKEPHIEDDCDYWTNKATTNYVVTLKNLGNLDDWKDSLEERPK